MLSGKLRFVGLRSFNLFLICIKYWQPFLRENLTIVRSDFVSRWHASILSCPMSKPILLKTLHAVCSKSFDSIDFGIPATSTHSRHEYWALVEHCLSVFSSCFRGVYYSQLLQFYFCHQKVHSEIRLILHFREKIYQLCFVQSFWRVFSIYNSNIFSQNCHSRQVK